MEFLRRKGPPYSKGPRLPPHKSNFKLIIDTLLPQNPSCFTISSFQTLILSFLFMHYPLDSSHFSSPSTLSPPARVTWVGYPLSTDLYVTAHNSPAETAPSNHTHCVFHGAKQGDHEEHEDVLHSLVIFQPQLSSFIHIFLDGRISCRPH